MPRRAISSSRRRDLLDQLGRQALGRLVDDDEVGVAHQRAAHGEHLLLAARQDAGLIGLALAQVREQPEHVVEGPAAELAGALQPELEVLLARSGAGKIWRSSGT